MFANERELLEELALLNNTTTRRSRTRPKAQPANNIEPEVGMVGEKRDEGEDQNDPWKKLKDFAGVLYELCRENISDALPNLPASENIECAVAERLFGGC
ncbi:hypothetical protein Prudu_008704 [Prunus dulcis]|uniref:Uncharacterized protein n=1 Tax=Prunus dulcis TaxID=3755 RepID=A0A4Y1R4P4_PRUDU|nr:hypothetical protein Prudu_008704 [Prunus dulcis]